MTNIKWRAWYANGSVYSSNEILWENLPVNDLVIAKAWLSKKKVLACGSDAIYFDENADPCFVNVNLPTKEFEELAQEISMKGLLKFGKHLPDDEYENLYNLALASQWEY